MHGGDELKTVRVNRFDMPYVDIGEGEPVVFVHGSISDHRCWNEHVSIVGRSHRAIAIDLRYFGTAAWTDDGENYSMQTHANDIGDFIQALNIAPATLVGWSYGGAVSFVVATQRPGLVDRLFLYEPNPATYVADLANLKRMTEDRVARFGPAMALVESDDLPAAVRAGIDGINGASGFFDTLPAALRKMHLDNARTMPLVAAAPPPPNVTADDLRELDMPVRILVGSETGIFAKIAARTAADLLPSAEYHSIDGALHVWPELDPVGFSHHLLAFLNRH